MCHSQDSLWRRPGAAIEARHHVGECESGGRTYTGTSFSVSKRALRKQGTSCTGYRGGCKPLQPSQTPEVGAAHHCISPPPPKGSTSLQRALQLGVSRCFHLPGNKLALLLPLPGTLWLDTTPTFLGVTANDKGPEARHKLPSPPPLWVTATVQDLATRCFLQALPIAPYPWKHP